MPRIFVSYRRDDSAGYAGRLYESLAGRFGRGKVFMDIDTIRPGEDFVKMIREEVAACEALVAVIGPTWLRVSDDHDRPRLQNPGDYVRIEIAHALSSGIRVIPVLVGRAEMPAASALPEDLRALANLHAFEIHDALFHDSLKQLLKEIGPAAPWALLKRSTTVLSLSVVVILVSAALINSPPSSRAPGTKPTPAEIEAERKEFPCAHQVDSSRIFDREETVYVHSYDRLMAISSSGKRLWELKTGTWPYENTGHPYALDDQGRLYITVNGGVICLGDK